MKKFAKATNTITTAKTTGIKGKLKRIYMFLYIQIGLLATALASPLSVSASSGAADAKWNAVIGFILPWIGRIGGVVILIGAIQFGLAWKSDDAEKKTAGMHTVVAGCIVTAVGLSANIFLN